MTAWRGKTAPSRQCLGKSLRLVACCDAMVASTLAPGPVSPHTNELGVLRAETLRPSSATPADLCVFGFEGVRRDAKRKGEGMYPACSEQDGRGGEQITFDRDRHIRFMSCAALSSKPAPARAFQRPVLTPRLTCRNASDEQWLGLEEGEFIGWLLGRAGVDSSCYRAAPLARRLPACLRSLRAHSLREARGRLAAEPDRLHHAVGALLIGVTEFFREPEVFAYLDESVFPKMTDADRGLRVWSVGCADGAELYSVAMLMARSGRFQDNVLFGTDCRAGAIREAERGWFEAARLDRLDPRLRQSYVTEEGDGGRVCETLRKATRWQQANILDDRGTDGAEWDVILCRNLAIYLDSPAAARMWDRLVRSLRVGGVLVVGKAERPERQPGLVRLRACVFEKRE